MLPNFGYFLFNLYDCGEFIRKNFDARIYIAYTKLKHVKNKLWKITPTVKSIQKL